MAGGAVIERPGQPAALGLRRSEFGDDLAGGGALLRILGQAPLD
jgi:hypothetical protein